jgi:arginase
MSPFAIIDVPSNLGLQASGAEGLPAALRRAGLDQRLRSRNAGSVVSAAPPQRSRDPLTGILNTAELRQTARQTAGAVALVAEQAEIPLVLAGDCSVVLGCLLGLRDAVRNRGGEPRPGLLFVDGHVDFYQPDASPTGEAADMDLALATGRGPLALARLDPTGPLVREEDVVAVGARDAAERDAAGSQDVAATGIHLFELDMLRRRGMEDVAHHAIAHLARADLTPGFWLHLDADVLDDTVMPAVDYRQPGGLSPLELQILLRVAHLSGRLAGMSIAIYNPALDPSGAAARALVEVVAAGLGAEPA